MRMNTGPDRIVSAIILIIVGILQVANPHYLQPWLVIVSLGLILMMNTR
jgi:hypothetical protein